MSDRIDDLTKRVEAVEARMDRVPAMIDQRFDAVDAAIAEQRQFTEFAFGKLERSMNAQFAAVDARFDAVDARFDAVDARFTGLEGEMRTVRLGLARLERKLDQFIDLHLPPPRSATPDPPR